MRFPIPLAVLVGVAGCARTTSSVCTELCPSLGGDALAACIIDAESCSSDPVATQSACVEAVQASYQSYCEVSDSDVDVDEDGVSALEDCDDENPDVGFRVLDVDCDGVIAAYDCDDADPNVGSKQDDMDCDGVPTAEDCDDRDSTAPSADDADCDGVDVDRDCDDDDAAVGACPLGIEYVSATWVGTGDIVGATCPAGKLVVGGGFRTSASGPRFYGMFPSGDGRSWGVFTDVGGSVTVYAACVSASLLSNYEVYTQSASVTPNTHPFTNYLACPSGKTLLGGGARFPFDAQGTMLNVDEFPTVNPERIGVSTLNQTGLTQSLEMRVICANVDATVYVKKTAGDASACDGAGGNRVLGVGASWSGTLWNASLGAGAGEVSSTVGVGTTTVVCVE
ncbi:MAG: hypothetical protein H6733_05190 [Alphaproteobacteria bacterium]|nr:hypothetical protein [Alphaproteobacteria bacterium]